MAALPVFAAAPLALNPQQVDYCRILYGCKLPVPHGFCPDSKRLGNASYAFDDTRCSEARTLQSRGVNPDNPVVGFSLYRFLGMEYRVIYEITDTVHISQARFEYLLNDLPLSAKLISHYQKMPYTAQYVDPAHLQFQGTKGKNLSGGARLISGSYAEKRLFYFGSGVVQVAFWKLTGPALMDFSYWPVPGKSWVLGYKMKILVFPENGFINKIMNLGLFRKIVFGKIREVVSDVTITADKLNAAGGADIQSSPDWTPAEKKKVADFFKLP